MIKEVETLVSNINMFMKFTQNVDGKNVNIFTYMYFNPIEYFNIKNKPFKKEIRGLTYVDVNFFPAIHKFFNVGENQYVLNWNDIKDDEKILSLEKIDGSLVSPVIINHKLFIKTKTSFKSRQVKHIYDLNLLSNKQKNIIKTLIEKYDLYPQFEFIAPFNRIVLIYPKPELILLCVRRKVGELDFEYVDIDTVKDIAKDLNVRTPNVEILTKSELIELQNNAENIEGFVIYYNNDLYKVKTKWYFYKHKLRPDNLTEKFIMELILNEEIDDLLSELEGDEYKIKVENYVNKIMNKLNQEYNELFRIKEIFDSMDVREFAIKYPEYRKYIKMLKSNMSVKDMLKNIWNKKYKKLSDIINDFGSIKYI